MHISLCTQILDRNLVLEQTLPTWLQYPWQEIIIFDYGIGIESAVKIASQYTDNRIKIYQNYTNLKYNSSIAKNNAIKLTTNQIVFYIDSDVKILNQPPIIHHNTFIQGYSCSMEEYYRRELKDFFFEDGICYSGKLNGTVMFWKDDFNKVNGFNENLTNWGYDDIDFYNRLQQLGVKKLNFGDILYHIDHSTNESIKYYDEKDRGSSNMINKNMAINNPWLSTHNQIMLNIKKL